MKRIRDAIVARGPRWPWAVAVFLVFMAAVLWRWHFASGTKIYTYDSYYYMTLARSLRGFHYSVAGHEHFKFMPAYPISIDLLSIFVPNLETAAKFGNVLFTSACIFPIYAIGALLFGRRAGLAAAGLFAFEPITSAWSSIPMSDGLLALLITLGAFFFLKWMKEENGRKVYLYLAAGAGGLAFLTRWEGALFLLLVGLFLLYFLAKKRLRFRHLVLFAVIALIPFGFYALRNLLVFGTPLKSAYLSEFFNHPKVYEQAGPLGRFGRYLMFSDVKPLGISKNWYHYAYLIFGYTGLAFSLAVKRYRRYGLFLVAWLFFLGPLHFIWWFGSVRFLFPAVPPLVIGAGALVSIPSLKVENATRKDFGVGLAAFALMVAVVSVLAITARPMANDIYNNGIIALEDDVGGLAARDALLWLKDNAGNAGVATNVGPMADFYLGRNAGFIGEWQGFEPADVNTDRLISDAQRLGVRYIVLWSWEDDPVAPFRYINLGPETLNQVTLVNKWEAPPSNEFNRTVYAWVFEIPQGTAAKG
jgi:4-amino-4-deoxy-L-arabinose transferase-like glycosyltransferase